MVVVVDALVIEWPVRSSENRVAIVDEHVLSHFEVVGLELCEIMDGSFVKVTLGGGKYAGVWWEGLAFDRVFRH